MSASAEGGVVTGVTPDAGDSEGARVMACLPSTAASAAVMNAANSEGTMSSLPRARMRMVSNASKLAASNSGRERTSRSRATITSTSCTPSASLARRPGWALGALQARLSAGSRRPARGEPNALRDLLEVIIWEPVPAQAQLPGQGPLAERLAARGRLLADNSGVVQQPRM